MTTRTVLRATATIEIEIAIATETVVGSRTSDPGTAAAHLDATGPKTAVLLIASSERISQIDAVTLSGTLEVPTIATIEALQICGLQ